MGSLLTGLLAIPAAAADSPPATAADPDRVRVVAAWQSGGPVVRRAAETVLTGSAADRKAFLATGQAAAAEQDLRARIEELIASSGPGVREAGTAALKGSAADLQKFLDQDGKKAFEDDQRVQLSQIMATGSPGVREAASKAMSGTLNDVLAFLNEGQFKARNDDDRVHLSQLMASGGPEVKKAAGTALDGTMDDVQDFLKYGYQTAAAHDQETLTVSQLADLTKTASAQAGQQAQTAKDAAGKAQDAGRLAKEAAERAAKETKEAQGQAGQASNAAGRAADAAGRAAAAAQTASNAAKSANEAAREAANAAANAAAAATKAGNAASRALAAAAGAAGDAGKADQARAAAVTARDAARDAHTAGEASAWAGAAAARAGLAALAAASAGVNAEAAAQAAADAAGYSGVAGAEADRARQAAARARKAAAEATRAANATVKIANDAAAAAADAQRAANAAAAHAEAAAAAAEEAAKHAGEAATWAGTAKTASEAAATAAESAANSAKQAHNVADIARASDQERLDAQQAAEMAAADEASRIQAQKDRKAAWEAGKATALAAETEQLIKDATATGVDAGTAVLKGRQAALRLLDAGGPWTRASAQTALEGDDEEVRAFLSTDLAVARDRDDRTNATAIAQASSKLEQRLAAETAAVGTPEQVRAFLATGQYPGKDDDDRVLLSQIMAAGGPGVKEAAGKALSGTMDDVRAFLTTGQYTARENDERVLVSQAIATGGPEVKAAAQAVMTGPADRLAPFLDAGLTKARERDAVTAAHIATIQSYLAATDGSVALARQYAAEASQSYADARHASDEANGYAQQAQTSAAQAADWAAKAAQSAQQAKASADQAAAYAKQARASASAAQAAARSADVSANAAAGYAQQAAGYAADAKKAADDARNSAVAAAKSRDEAYAAAREAALFIMSKQQAESADGKMQHETASIDEAGRVTYIEAVPKGDMKPQVLKDDSVHCMNGDPSQGMASWFQDSAWHDNAAGKSVCSVKATLKVTGTVDYILRTCPEANLTIAACQGKYSTWDTLLLKSEHQEYQYDTVLEMSLTDWVTKYSPQAQSRQILANLFFGDFIRCFDDPGHNASSCAWAASNFIPFGTLAKAAKGIVAFRFALETGVELEHAKLALQATLEGFSEAAKLKFLATADAIAALRLTYKDGVGTDAALAAARKFPEVDPALARQLDAEVDSVKYVTESCERNSFPAGTQVLLSDGSYRAISEIRTGDLVLATDPATGKTGPQPVNATYVHPTKRLVDISLADGSTLSTTAGHRLYTEQADWTLASALRPGDRLRGSDGTSQVVTGVTDRTDLPSEAVFDLTVDGPHTFFVRAGGGQERDLLVHNCFYLLNDERMPDVHTIDAHVAQGPYGANGAMMGTTPALAQAKAEVDGIAGVFSDLATAEEALQQAWASKGAARYAIETRRKSHEFRFRAEVTLLDSAGVKRTSLGEVYRQGGGGVSAPSSTTVEVMVRIVGKDRHPKGWYVTSIFPLPRGGV
ncbi:polymorphic toxin-type HINT domain-containing protein [Kitasatospora purpeofusca]|uniref:polymorphic toxin-type HINT domain-containing protein n=1 Tax=Kitasatospora purpeofusca TaxID=67352 RepID=UPI0036D42464